MKIFIDVRELAQEYDLTTEDGRVAAVGMAITKATEAYTFHFSDGGTYVDDIDPENVLWGAEYPKEIVEKSRTWNGEIRKDFRKAISVFNAAMEATGEMPFDDVITNRLCKCAMALNNEPHLFGYMANGIGDGLDVALTREQMQNICAHPEYYAIVDVPIAW